MAATQYQIYCRYFHSTMNKMVTNETTAEWKQAEESHPHDTNGHQQSILPTTTHKSGEEVMLIRQYDIFGRSLDLNQGADISNIINQQKQRSLAIDAAMTLVINNEMTSDNPKYDMMFIYDGIASCTGPNSDNPWIGGGNKALNTEQIAENAKAAPEVYYEKMRRLEIPAPWFLYATCASLRMAMIKAEEIVKIMTPENVFIGKVVNLDDYIDIV